jgi:outer membrane protein TolC
MFCKPAGARRRIIIGLSTVVLLLPLGSRALTLEEAESLALARDAGVAGLEERSAALAEAAVADAQLPDPELRFGAVNLPTDSFELDEQAMTQLLVGVRQRFPRGQTRALSRDRAESMAQAESARARDRRRMVVRSLRQAWIERGYAGESLGIVERQQSWFRQLEEAAISAYAAGGRRQNDLFRIAMERELLEDELVRIRQTALVWDAELGRWLGSAADAAATDGIPGLPALLSRESGLEQLAFHPLLQSGRHTVEAGGFGVDIAKQAYRPAWALDLSYGYRQGEDPMGDDRPDFFSAMVSFDLPIFPRHRQDRRVAAATATELELKSRVEDDRRGLKQRFDSAWAARESLTGRIALFEERIIPAAEANVEASRQAYRNDVVPFDELVRSEKTLLDARVRLLRLRADMAVNVAELLYLTGETP